VSRLDNQAYNSVNRFSARASNYARCRPGYPLETVDQLKAAIGPGADIADVGSGTGIYTGLLLEGGFRVFAIEPSRAMAAQAKARLGRVPGFTQVIATAEQTTLPDKSVDAIVCAQSFHWFSESKAAVEFRRILRGGGTIAMLWNSMATDADDINAEYQRLIKKMSPDFGAFRLGGVVYSQGHFEALFAPASVCLHRWQHEETLSLEGLIGRTKSLSFCPSPDTEGYRDLIASLDALFRRYGQNNTVSLRYDTVMYLISAIDTRTS
jgi:SAM-dependent methyltransferase